MYGQEAQAPLIEMQLFVQSAFFLAIFLKYFVRTNWRGGDESLLENCTIYCYAF